MESTKTTFFLPNALRTKLKLLASREGVTVTQLLTQGAEMVIARHGGSIDREELERRAAAAREKLRRGVYSGTPISDSIDEIVYGPGRRGAAHRGNR